MTDQTKNVEQAAREALLARIAEFATQSANAHTVERLARAYHHVVSAGDDGSPSVFFLND